jgi:exopolysaccharide biosynthesis polyprenyl glycosylphosphotransferase
MAPNGGSDTVVAGQAPASAHPVAVETAEDGLLSGRRTGSRVVHLGRGWFVRRLLLAADVLALTAAFLLAEIVFGPGGLLGSLAFATELAIFLVTIPLWVVVIKLYGLYERDDYDVDHSTLSDLSRVVNLVTFAVWFAFVASRALEVGELRAKPLAVFWITAIAAIIASRTAARAFAHRRTSYIQNTIIVGAGDIGQLIGRKIRQHPEYGINLVGFVDAHPKERRREVSDVELLGGLPELDDVVGRNDVDRVIIAFSNERDVDMLAALRSLRRHSVHVDIVPRFFEAVSPNIGIHTVEGLPLLASADTHASRSSRFIKRCIDIAGSAFLLALLAPTMLLIAVLIRRDSRGPALFRQTRIGKDMREFTLLKFRTMRWDAEDGPHRDYVSQIMTPYAQPGANSLYKLDRAHDVTRVGRWLRKTSLDELPQLINVLYGDMSLVGPRPCIPYELDLYSPHHFERFRVPAGLTGLWQVKARARSTLYEALDLDVAYVRTWSLGLDLRLLLSTPLLIFRKTETG